MGGERNEVNRIKSMMHMHGDVITKFIHSYNEYVLIKKEKMNNLFRKMDRSEEKTHQRAS